MAATIPEPTSLSRRRVLATLLGVLAAGAAPGAAAADRRVPVRSMLELRRQAVVVQDRDLSCGAAALATLLTYQHDDPVTEREILRALISRDIYLDDPELIQLRHGFSLLDLRRVAEGRGYAGHGFGNLALEDALDLAPLITPIRSKGYNHFVVLIGRVGDRVFVADPAFGNLTLAENRFRRMWLDIPELGHVGFIVSRGDTPDLPGRLRPDPRVFMMPPPAAIRARL